MQRVPTLSSFGARGAARVMGARLKSTGRGSRAPGSARAGADLSSPGWSVPQAKTAARDPAVATVPAHSWVLSARAGRSFFLVDPGPFGSAGLRAVEDSDAVAMKNGNALCGLLEETPLLVQGAPPLGSRKQTRGPRGLQELAVGDVKILHIF